MKREGSGRAGKHRERRNMEADLERTGGSISHIKIGGSGLEAGRVRGYRGLRG